MPEFYFDRILDGKLLRLCPKGILSQIEGVTPEMIDRIQVFAPLLVAAQTNYIYGAFDKDSNRFCGLLWCGLDIIESCIFVRFFSMKKEYQGGALKKAIEFLFEDFKESKVEKKIICVTARPKAFYEAGFKDTKYSHLIYEQGEEDE